MQVVILAGGLATRLRPITLTMPKSMVPVNGRPFLAYQLDVLRQAGIKDIVLCIGHLGEDIIHHFGDGHDYGVHLRYSSEDEMLLGTGGALKKAAPLLDEHFFVMYGDSYLRFDYAGMCRAFLDAGCMAMMAVYKNENTLDRSNVVLGQGRVAVFDKHQTHPKMDHIDYGITVLNRGLLENIPAGEVFDLAELFRRLAQEGLLFAYEVHERFYEIGSLYGLEDFKSFLEKGEH